MSQKYLKETRRLVYSNAIIIDSNSHILGPYFLPTRGKRHVQMPFPHNPFDYNRLKKEDFVPSGSVLLRMNKAKEAKGFDESLKIGEDWDLWLRLSEEHPVEYLPIPTYLYRVHDASLIGRAIVEKKLDDINNVIKSKIKERAKERKKKEPN